MLFCMMTVYIVRILGVSAFQAALDTWQIDWGNKHNRNLISDSLECELCSFTDGW